MHYANVKDNIVVGVVNWDGKEAHPYGDTADLRGPLPEGEGAVEWMGKSAAVLDAALAKHSEPIALLSRTAFEGPRGAFQHDPNAARRTPLKSSGRVFNVGDPDYKPPKTAEEAIAWMRDDGDADPEGTAKLNFPHLFPKKDDFERAAKRLDEAPVPQRTSGEAKAIRDAMGEPMPLTAAQVLAADKAGGMKHFTFMAEAKRILGAPLPEGKDAILRALQKIA